MKRENQDKGVPYGAFDQKRLYQRHMMFGVGVVNLIVLALLILVSTLLEQPVARVETRNVDSDNDYYLPFDPTIVILPDLPTISPTRPKTQTPDGGLFTPLEDSIILAEDTAITDQTTDIPELSFGEFSGEENSADGRNHYSGSFGRNGTPNPREIIIPDVQPTFVVVVKPDYPPLALRAGLEGTVWVQALVDEKGIVSKVVIIKESGARVGFEEASVEAANKCRFSPALKDGRAIKIWVTFPFEFKLSN